LAHDSDKAGDGIKREPLQIPDAAVRAVEGGCKVAVHRTGQVMQITLTSSDEYASIKLYDSLVQSVRKGSLRLELKAPAPEPAEKAIMP